MTWMVKTQEEGDEKQRAGREKRGRKSSRETGKDGRGGKARGL